MVLRHRKPLVVRSTQYVREVVVQFWGATSSKQICGQLGAAETASWAAAPKNSWFPKSEPSVTVICNWSPHGLLLMRAVPMVPKLELLQTVRS